MSDEEDIEPHERTLARALEAWSRDWSEARLTDYDIALALEMAIAERYAAVGLERGVYTSKGYLGSYPTVAFCARLRDDIIRLASYFSNFDSNTDEWHLRYVDGIIRYSEEYIEQSEYPLDTPPTKGMSDYSSVATDSWRRFASNCRHWLRKLRYVDASRQSYYTHCTIQNISERINEPELNHSEIEEADAELVAGTTPKWLADLTEQYACSEESIEYYRSSLEDAPELFDIITDRNGEFYSGLFTRNTSPLQGDVYIVPTSRREPNYYYSIQAHTSLGYHKPYFIKHYEATIKTAGTCATQEYEYEVSYNESCTYTEVNRSFSVDGSRSVEDVVERTKNWAEYYVNALEYTQNNIPLTLTQYERGRLNSTGIIVHSFSTVSVLPVLTGQRDILSPSKPDKPPNYDYDSKSYFAFDTFTLNIIIDYNTGYSFKEE